MAEKSPSSLHSLMNEHIQPVIDPINEDIHHLNGSSPISTKISPLDPTSSQWIGSSRTLFPMDKTAPFISNSINPHASQLPTGSMFYRPEKTPASIHPFQIPSVQSPQSFQPISTHRPFHPFPFPMSYNRVLPSGALASYSLPPVKSEIPFITRSTPKKPRKSTEALDIHWNYTSSCVEYTNWESLVDRYIETSLKTVYKSQVDHLALRFQSVIEMCHQKIETGLVGIDSALWPAEASLAWLFDKKLKPKKKKPIKKREPEPDPFSVSNTFFALSADEDDVDDHRDDPVFGNRRSRKKPDSPHKRLDSPRKKKSIENPELHVQSQPVQWTDVDNDHLYQQIIKKQLPKVLKNCHQATSIILQNAKRIAHVAAREVRKWLLRRHRLAHATSYVPSSDTATRARRLMKEMLAFWKRSERDHKEKLKRLQKAESEKKRLEEEAREAKRQAKKLDFLISQSELYSDFISKKYAKGETIEKSLKKSSIRTKDDKVLLQHPEDEMYLELTVNELMAAELEEEQLDRIFKYKAETRAQAAVDKLHDHTKSFERPMIDDHLESRTSIKIEEKVEFKIPTMLKCQLKLYQKKGLEWLMRLYSQGINGILADEMGLGKTVQSLSFLAWLAEIEGIWGPFLIVAPVSTLHNWQQEIDKFTPSFRVLPYWGASADRKILRKYWAPWLKQSTSSQTHEEQKKGYHIVITSYQMLVQDEKYFKAVRWRYMILDEAQAIKSSSSLRWKSLLQLPCRNRLLLTGTPIQNNMNELWALLHFIMPGLFDSHEEFSEWFSKDIESSATSGRSSSFQMTQLVRLHQILKPFMLRRIKKDVENELGEKIELDLQCGLSSRQRYLYDLLRARISLPNKKRKEGLTKASLDHLMNLVMQFRKVCNHPFLIEASGVSSPFVCGVHRAVDSEDIYVKSMDSGLRTEALLFAKRMLNEKCPENKTMNDIQQCVYSRIISYRYIQRIFPLSTINSLNEKIILSMLESLGEQHLIHEVIYRPKVISPKRPAQVLKSLTDNLFYVKAKLASDCESIYHSIENEAIISPLEDSRFAPWLSSPPLLERFIQVSGKMQQIHPLLLRLRANLADNNKVLIYFQMTRMMDFFEDYCRSLGFPYLRLDGSSKLSDRKAMVHRWQIEPSSQSFIFLLSTRAGGLGLNLTSANTVIFYDSDWNPTQDCQAMDRAHRLGQTRQVTVYRCTTTGTIEERILQKAQQKNRIQKMVISGHEKKYIKNEQGDYVECEETPEEELDMDGSLELKSKEIVQLLFQEAL